MESTFAPNPSKTTSSVPSAEETTQPLSRPATVTANPNKDTLLASETTRIPPRPPAAYDAAYDVPSKDETSGGETIRDPTRLPTQSAPVVAPGDEFPAPTATKPMLPYTKPTPEASTAVVLTEGEVKKLPVDTADNESMTPGLTITTATGAEAKAATGGKLAEPRLSFKRAHIELMVARDTVKVVNTESFRCPPNAHASTVVWPLKSFDDCSCFSGHKKTGMQCAISTNDTHTAQSMGSQEVPSSFQSTESSSAKENAAAHYNVLIDTYSSILDFYTKGSMLGRIAQSDQHYTLINALLATKLDVLLNDSAAATDYTVFAPTDQAFAEALGENASKVLDSPGILSEVLKNHVVPSLIESKDLNHQQSITALSGMKSTIDLSGPNPKVGAAHITASDLVATNGVVHVIDKVLMTNNDVEKINNMLAGKKAKAAAPETPLADTFRLSSSVSKINGTYKKVSRYPGVQEAHEKDTGDYVFFKYKNLVAIARIGVFETGHDSPDKSNWEVVYRESSGASDVGKSRTLQYLSQDGSIVLSTTVEITPS